MRLEVGTEQKDYHWRVITSYDTCKCHGNLLNLEAGHNGPKQEKDTRYDFPLFLSVPIHRRSLDDGPCHPPRKPVRRSSPMSDKFVQSAMAVLLVIAIVLFGTMFILASF